jgi:SHS2 domain-containing protein
VAYGASLPEAFANAAYGMFSIIADLRNVREKESRVVELAEKDSESLLFEWLNALIFHFDVDHLLFKRCEVTDFDGKSLRAVCHGEPVDPHRHRLKMGIKSATYHHLAVNKEKNQVRVIFDV